MRHRSSQHRPNRHRLRRLPTRRPSPQCLHRNSRPLASRTFPPPMRSSFSRLDRRSSRDFRPSSRPRSRRATRRLPTAWAKMLRGCRQNWRWPKRCQRQAASPRPQRQRPQRLPAAEMRILPHRQHPRPPRLRLPRLPLLRRSPPWPAFRLRRRRRSPQRRHLPSRRRMTLPQPRQRLRLSRARPFSNRCEQFRAT